MQEARVQGCLKICLSNHVQPTELFQKKRSIVVRYYRPTFLLTAVTSDALFVARRLREEAWGAQYGSLLFLALDWATALQLLTQCLRTGLCIHCAGSASKAFCKLIGPFIQGNAFESVTAAVMSDAQSQHLGIPQGCPLSLFLFSMLMTVSISNANWTCKPEQVLPAKNTPVSELMYADETLVVAADAEKAGQYMTCSQAAPTAWHSTEARLWPCQCAVRSKSRSLTARTSSVRNPCATWVPC